MVTKVLLAFVALLIPAVVWRPVISLARGARESYWFAKTYQMPNSWKLGNRLMAYAGLWILGGILTMVPIWMVARMVTQ